MGGTYVVTPWGLAPGLREPYPRLSVRIPASSFYGLPPSGLFFGPVHEPAPEQVCPVVAQSLQAFPRFPHVEALGFMQEPPAQHPVKHVSKLQLPLEPLDEPEEEPDDEPPLDGPDELPLDEPDELLLEDDVDGPEQRPV